MESYEVAKVHTLSNIQGPPGTGKTFNAAVILHSLSQEEVGKIVATAPSNEAADNLAECLVKLNDRFKLRKRVIRIFSKSREKELLRSFGNGNLIHYFG